MVAQYLVMLDFVGNNVENASTESQVSSKKDQKFFAGVGVHPHTSLKFYESSLDKERA